MRECSTLSEDNLFNIALATGEALQNIVRYGYLFEDAHEVRLSLECLDKVFVVKVMDDAPPCPVEKFMHRTLTPTAAKIPIMATTTSSSIKEKPDCKDLCISHIPEKI